MVKNMVLEAGLTVALLVALFVFSVAVGLALPASREAIAELLPQFVVALFTAIMLALDPRRLFPTRQDETPPPSPPVERYAPDETREERP